MRIHYLIQSLPLIKRLVSLSILFFINIYSWEAFSQVRDWQQTAYPLIGYQYDHYKYQPAAYYIPSFPNNTPVTISEGKYTTSRLFMGIETFGKNVYFQGDFTILGDLLGLLFSKEPNYLKGTPAGSPRLRFDNINFGPFKLGFGGRITQHFAMYLGGQYSYQFHGVRSQLSVDNYDMISGGNQRGVGGNFLFSLSENWIIRYNLEYNWVRYQKKTVHGNSIGHDIMLMFKVKGLGIFSSVNLMQRTTDSVKLESTTTNSYYGTYSYPEFKANTFTFRVGVIFNGLGQLMQGTADVMRHSY